jgi:catechol 2,3-dioxygenase-like lactoylglutathione lyase family enzyme
MSALVRGTHHITYCPARAQEDVDFLTTVLGQRLVKQTVLMDGRIPIHHLYYGNADADIGSITTSFPYSKRAFPSEPPRSGESISIATGPRTMVSKSGLASGSSGCIIRPVSPSS